MSETEETPSRRPDDDTRCPTCGGSAHALDAVTRERFGGREYVPRYARKALDAAWGESDRLADELDSTYAHMRAVIENCKRTDSAAIRHQLVGLLPEVRPMSPEATEKARAEGGQWAALVERHEARVRENWAKLGYPEAPDA